MEKCVFNLQIFGKFPTNFLFDIILWKYTMNDAYSFQLCYVLQPKVYLLYVGKCSMQTSGEHVFWCCWIEYSVNINWIKFNDTAIYMVIYIFVDFLSAHLLIFCLLINCWQRGIQFSSVQSLSHVRHFVTPWTAACQASLSITSSQSLFKLMSIESMMASISSSVVPFSHLQSFPASGSFQMSRFFASGGQSIGVSASASVFPMNIQDWSPLGWTSWISLQSNGLSRIFSNTTAHKHQFFGAQLSL